MEDVKMNDTTVDRLLLGVMSRRRLFRTSLMAAGGFFATSLLAACGGDDDDEAGADETSSDPTATEVPAEDSGSEEESTATEETEEEPTAAEDDEPSQDEGEGVYGGTLTAAMETPPPTLDFMSSGTAATRIVARPTIEPLATVGDDFTAIPMLAESWEASDDGKEYTFKLRQNVPFHNGKMLSAEDVIASMDRFLAVSARAGEFEIVESYEAVDESTVVFTLNNATLGFVDSIAYPLTYFGILPKEIVESIDDTNVQLEHMVGTGPYKMVEWIPDQLVRYERFEDYASRDEPRNGLGGGKTPYFDEIVYLSVPEPGSRVAGLETGEYDYDASPVTTEFDRLEESPDITPYINENAGMSVFFFNHDDPITGNLQFRQAIQAGVNLEEFALAITNGRSDFFKMDSSIWFPPTTWHNEQGADLYNQNNVDKAKKLLDESGYDGEAIILLTNRNYDQHFKTTVTLDEFLKSELGINTTVETLDWPGQVERTNQSEGWHIAPTGFVSAPTYGPAAWEQFMGTGNSWGYSNEDMDAAFEKFQTAETQEERVEAANTIQQVFYETVHMVKIANVFGLEALRAEIKGFEPFYEPRFWSCWREE